MNNKKMIRRSITINKELDDIIQVMKEKYSYRVKNELIIELIELGILKYEEDLEMKTKINQLLNKLNQLLEPSGK